MKKILVVTLLLAATFYVRANVGAYRGFQLDSIVTNIDKQVLKNLDSLHHFVDQWAVSNEEKVFMYYGVIAIHYKYDKKRAKLSRKKSVEYTPHYTTYKRKGVCRDFAVLIKELCDRSNIPCVVAVGRSKVNFFKGVIDFFLFKLDDSNHAWNVVKYDANWHIIDATWGYVSEVKKKKYVDENGRIKRAKIKIASRKYYDPMYDDVYSKRKAEHPAYYAESTVYTYKTIYKSKESRVPLDTNYNYNQVLDSLSSNDFFKFSSQYEDSASVYSDNTSSWYYFQIYHDFLKLKRSKFNRLTSLDCEKHLAELDNLERYLLYKEGKSFAPFSRHRLEVEKKLLKLKKKEGIN
jgi:hypothetical protein